MLYSEVKSVQYNTNSYDVKKSEEELSSSWDGQPWPQ